MRSSTCPRGVKESAHPPSPHIKEQTGGCIPGTVSFELYCTLN